MAVTKTNFINYIRCPRYVALDDLKREKLNSNVSLAEYLKEEEDAYLAEILDDMYDEEGNDLIDVANEHLTVMLPYYNQVELLAGSLAPKYFDGTFKYSKDTKDQESFDAVINGIRYLCYVDIYNEIESAFNIIEVKATTSNLYLNLGQGEKNDFGKREVTSIFKMGDDHIYHLLEESDKIEDHMTEKSYYNARSKLSDRFHKAGHYVYDLVVQRYIIENDLKNNQMADKIPSIKYYLAVLNHQYVYDGKMEANKNIYATDSSGNDIISYFDMTKITGEMMDLVDLDRKRVELYIKNLKIDPVPLGEYCENKKTTKCKYTKECWKHIPIKNSILNYIDNHNGFKDADGNKYDRYDLINDGKVRMLDIPVSLLNREKNVIQRQVVATNIPYINKRKIKDGLGSITYPIYHLDFETFPCPLPRLKGEKCYTQSVFQFSLHIESSPGLCDKETDHYQYLAKDHADNREELIKKLCEYIDVDSGGTILVYNESFEKTRLKELGEIFPLYQKSLNKMREMIFDLMNLVKTKSSLYEELGYSSEEAKMFNYYDAEMSGSFSIKKILPLFSNLSYADMEIGNGMDAVITYASFPNLSPLEYQNKYQKMIEYCQQDTWAMVEILHGLIDCVK